MIQKTPTHYAVDNDEIVTITVVATKVGEFVATSLDGGGLDPIGMAPLKYRFTATKSPRTNHFVLLQCHFPNSAPDDANYAISAQGSNGGGVFNADKISKSNPPSTWNTFLEFSVA